MVYQTGLARGYWLRKAVLAVLFVITGVILMRYPIISHPILKIVVPPLPMIAALFELWSWISASRGGMTLDENGDLHTKAGIIKAAQMREIHVLEWRGRYLAKLDYRLNNQSQRTRRGTARAAGVEKGRGTEGDLSIKMDGWMYDGLDTMIKAIYARLHPEEEKKEDTSSPEGSSPDKAAPHME